jgi:mono/diheme cytochrome c family protein
LLRRASFVPEIPLSLRLALPAAVLILVAGAVQAGTWPARRKDDVAEGRALFDRSCWMCHGRYGQGDGPAATSLQVPVPSLLGVSAPDRRDALVPVIQQGRGAMPGFSYTVTKPDTRRILAFLETLDEGSAAREAAAKAAEEEEADEEADEDVPAGGAEGAE